MSMFINFTKFGYSRSGLSLAHTEVRLKLSILRKPFGLSWLLLGDLTR